MSGGSAEIGRRKWLPGVLLAGTVALGLVACGGSGSSSSSSTTTPSTPSTPAPTASTRSTSTAVPSGHGAVAVLYAASLQNLMNKAVGPAFAKATSLSFNGFPAGSGDLANEIKGKVRQGDVFISAAPAVNAKLEGAANGSWVSWYAPFASTSLVIGYNPSSRFAAQLKTKPWYQVVTEPGFRLGFTDPKLDPKGVLSVAALGEAAATHHEPALAKLATNTSDLFPEQDLVGRLQAGQLDAGFFYTVESGVAKIPTVSLGSIKKAGKYTITVLAGAPNQAGAIAFVKFLLGSRGEGLMRAAGLTVTSAPAAVGTGVPPSLSGVVHG